MFSLFKKKPPAEATSTFKTRVQNFWNWYAANAQRFSQAVACKNHGALTGEISEEVRRLIPDAAWELGGLPQSPVHAFVLTGEGNLHLQLLTRFWHELAPPIPGWTFFPARQAGSLRDSNLKIGDRNFEPSSFWLVPSPNTDTEKIDIAVWHPEFPLFDDKTRWTVLFLFLDQVLGEYGTQQFVGEITFKPDRLGDAIAISELNDFLCKTQSKHNWQTFLPGESATFFSFDEPHHRFPRGDIITGVTRNRALLNDYLEAQGKLSDPLHGTGADYVYLAIDCKILPRGEEADFRGKIEDAMETTLRTNCSGRLIGGAHGTKNAYIDLLIFDGQNSIDLIRQTLQQNPIPGGANLHYFAKEKRDQKILI